MGKLILSLICLLLVISICLHKASIIRNKNKLEVVYRNDKVDSLYRTSDSIKVINSLLVLNIKNKENNIKNIKNNIKNINYSKRYEEIYNADDSAQWILFKGLLAEHRKNPFTRNE